MAPHLASLLTLGFIAFLCRRDNRQKPGVTGALWLPLLWILAIIGKSVAEWLRILTGITVDGTISPDSVVWTVLIIAGIRILARRQVSMLEVVRNNRFLSAYLLYALMSAFWSESPLWSLKHLIATLGNPIMALIILTEPDPEAAFVWVLKRCSYVVLPVSILLIRYYPQWGISFSPWSGGAQKAGFAYDKNSLGVICVIGGSFFAWHLFNVWKTARSKTRRDELLLCAGFLLMVAYLFNGLHCGTALVSFAVAVMMLLLIGIPGINKRHIGRYLLAGATLLLVANLFFGLKGMLLDALEKDPTLTSRTVMWSYLLQAQINPVLGTGYDSFWQENQTEQLLDTYYGPTDSRPNEAHNGYLETYLNLGLVGLFLLAGWIVATFQKCQSALLRQDHLGSFRLSFLVATVLYNWTEAGFKTITPMFFMFFIIALDYPQPQWIAGSHHFENTDAGEQPELVHAGECP